jgi:hypothetical protein
MPFCRLHEASAWLIGGYSKQAETGQLAHICSNLPNDEAGGNHQRETSVIATE